MTISFRVLKIRKKLGNLKFLRENRKFERLEGLLRQKDFKVY
jgi:hypothetical protein